MTAPERLLTVREVAELLGDISDRKVLTLCRTGRIAHIKGARSPRFLPADVTAYINAQRRPGVPDRAVDAHAAEVARRQAASKRRATNRSRKAA